MFQGEAITPVILASFIVSFLAFVSSVAGLFISKRRFALAVQVAIPLAIIAFAGTFSTYRFRHAGLWLPPLPDNVGSWKAVDTPVSKDTLALLGFPMARAHEYQNQFGEVVYSSAVCAGPFENYHDPTVCVAGNGFDLTAKKTIPMGVGEWKVRAMIFRKATPSGDVRIMMYYWTQTRRGNTATEARMGNFRDMAARLQTGYSSVVRGEQNVIMRIYTVIPPKDVDGVQSQRNLNEVSTSTYKLLLADGAKKN
jgi:hypothetical protein